jgi:hypothetical protein
VNTLPTEPAWAGKRVNYGKDRCAYIPKSQQVAAQAAQAAAAQSLVAQSATLGPGAGPNPFGSPFSPYPFATDMTGGQSPNRTVYLGNIHPETTAEDLCNAIRGGVLQSVRYMQDKHIAVSPVFLCCVHLPIYLRGGSSSPSSTQLRRSHSSKWHLTKVSL